MKKKILRIGLSVLVTLLILFTILQIVLLCQIYVSDASKASYLYNKDYFWLKGLCGREDIVKKGDILMLGRYPTAENGDTRPIAWKVVLVNRENVELLAVNILDVMPQHEERRVSYKDLIIPWSRSYLRKWLNESFYDTAFTEKEKPYLVQRDVTTNYRGNTSGASMGIDHSPDWVYIPYIDDLPYIKSKDLVAPMTPYAFRKWEHIVATTVDVHKTNGHYAEEWNAIVWVDDNRNGTWWLRSPGYFETAATYVTPNNDIWNVYSFAIPNGITHSHTFVSADDPSIGVRPMICIQTEDIPRIHQLTHTMT